MKCDCGVESSKAIPRFPWYCACGAKWLDSETRERPPCKYLGERMGGVFVDCGGCSSGKLQVYLCQIHGRTVQRKPVIKAGRPIWNGVNCVTCEQREEADNVAR